MIDETKQSILILLDYILGFLFKIVFVLILLVFHIPQVLAYNLFGKQAQQKVIIYMNGAILLAFKIAGTTSKVHFNYTPPSGQPIIFIANHQSQWDIIGFYWYLRDYKPVFVSKITLSRGIPSISYNLKKSGAALINRQDRKQALAEILRLSQLIHDENLSAVIFPEGTRSKKGALKAFAHGGLAGLIKKAPNAIIIPVVIQGTATLEANRYYRIKAFKHISWTVLDPIPTLGLNPEQIIQQSKAKIKEVMDVSS